MLTWFVTGCSSGLGRALAEAVPERGDRLVATARDPRTVSDLAERFPDRVLPVALDVTDRAACAAAVRAGEERFGPVDVLVNNAGHGYRAAVEEGEPDGIAEQFDTHFFGPLALIRAVLPGMRRRRSGTIVNVSSVGTRWTPAGSGFYVASKAALATLSGSLYAEVEPLGIRVVVVEPGGFRTEFTGRSLTESAVVLPDYAATAGARRRAADRSHGTQPGDPVKGAQAIITAVTAAEPPRLLLLGSVATARFDAREAADRAEVEAWRKVSEGTDFSR
ncbi:oxidoreductase [Pseudonocardia thermophila]|jgi:Short-chain alcohol dehydrogenase of unknown specificity|uniref:oxidoreductase n=1 Tax=Pseudonocardia thermophila TaxID=1848 RepID=UPI00248DC400|nr:oxidoreductase [Pseudonocardia thermophila]